MKNKLLILLSTFSFAAAYLMVSPATAQTMPPSGGHGDHGSGHGGGHDGGGGGHEGGQHGVALKTGRYTGHLAVASSGVKIHASLDLFHTQSETDYPKLSGVLKLRFGGSRSTEYVTYLYDKVLFDPNTNLLALDQNGVGLTISKLMVHDKMLMGDFRSNIAGHMGSVSLDFVRSYDPAPIEPGEPPGEDCLPDEPCDGPEEPSSPPGGGGGSGGHGPHHLMSAPFKLGASNSQFVSSLAGEYLGRCEGQPHALQIITSRSRDELEQKRNPFATYHITGSLGRLKDSKKVAVYSSGSYDFFSGKIVLNGMPKASVCQLTGNRLTCGACSFERKVATETKITNANASDHQPRGNSIDRGSFPKIEGTPEASDVAGEYFGYLHHELLNRYQPVRLSLNAFLHTDVMHGPAQLYISPLFELYFGGFDSSEKILYRFDTRQWLYSQGAMVIGGDDEETFGVVREWRKGMILLDWYSKNFGRVGTLELVRGRQPQLPSTFERVPRLSGKYLGPILHLDLEVTDAGDLEPEPAHPFFPLVVSGSSQIRGKSPSHGVSGTSYDFYTGAIAIETSNGNFLSGITSKRGELQLFTLGVNSFALPFLPMDYQTYRRK